MSTACDAAIKLSRAPSRRLDPTAIRSVARKVSLPRAASPVPPALLARLTGGGVAAQVHRVRRLVDSGVAGEGLVAGEDVGRLGRASCGVFCSRACLPLCMSPVPTRCALSLAGHRKREVSPLWGTRPLLAGEVSGTAVGSVDSCAVRMSGLTPIEFEMIDSHVAHAARLPSNNTSQLNRQGPMKVSARVQRSGSPVCGSGRSSARRIRY